ncbi:MAG: AAA family ATPase [Rectinemataceae bacterium]|jgi:hypothetical protein
MRFAVRGFRSFKDWVEFDGARVNVLFGPNSSGKSSLAAACILLREQSDPFRLSFAGGSHGLPSFLDAVRDRDPKGRIDFLLHASVDAAAALFPSGQVRPEPVPYDFELGLSYAGDPFDGAASGLLVEFTLDLARDGERVRLFAARPCEGGGELSLSLEEVLGLPFVRARAIAADSERNDSIADVDRAIEAAASLASSSRGEAASKARLLRASLDAARAEAIRNRDLERVILPDPPEGPARRLGFRRRERSCRYSSAEPKYLRSLADILVAECLAENGIRSMRSVESGKEIRLSFYSVFYEILAAAGFLRPARPAFLARFPARGPFPGASPASACATAAGTSALVRGAECEYAAILRDAVNFAACRGEDGSCAIEGGRLDEPYGRVVIAFREANGGAALVAEGRDLDPSVLDLEGRREALRSFLSGCGIAEDLEFRAGASEEQSIALVKEGTRRRLGDEGEGLRRLVLVASSILFLPWGSLVTIEEPEAGLDAAFQARMAELLRILVRTTGANVLAETRSADFVSALDPKSGDGEIRVIQLPQGA